MACSSIVPLASAPRIPGKVLAMLQGLGLLAPVKYFLFHCRIEQRVGTIEP